MSVTFNELNASQIRMYITFNVRSAQRIIKKTLYTKRRTRLASHHIVALRCCTYNINLYKASDVCIKSNINFVVGWMDIVMRIKVYDNGRWTRARFLFLRGGLRDLNQAPDDHKLMI